MRKRTPDHIVFGGTFDPPHQGHIDCVVLAQRTFPEAKISIIPSPAPAGAGDKHKNEVTALALRNEMVRLAMSPVLSEKVCLSDIETTLSAPNYTFQTLTALRTQQPTEKLALLIGEDQLAHFADWREPKQILSLADVLVARREGQRYLGEDPWVKLGQKLGVEIEPFTDGAYCRELDTYLWVLDGRISEASSTAIRAAYRENKPIPKGWLPGPLAAWIAQQNLYAKKDRA